MNKLMNISVMVNVLGALRNQVGRAELKLELQDGSCVTDAIVASGLEDRVDLWVLVDGRRANRDTVLVDGSRLTFFQPVGGG